MATIKSYTDIEQSKALAKILPLESADMCYVSKDDRGIEFFEEPDVIDGTLEDVDIRCWSLAALLGVLPKYELYNFGDTIQLDVNREALATEGDETLLDLVVNMIIHLHKFKNKNYG